MWDLKANKYSNDQIQMQDWGLLICLINSIKTSHTYKQIIKEFEIQQVKNQTALDIINHQIKNNRYKN